MTDDKNFEPGMKVRRAVLGDEHVNNAEANKTPFDADFQQFITETAWGSVWTRTGLDRRTRHLITLAVLAALGKEHELALHIRATQNTGVTQEELKEVFMQVAIYACVPAANRAFSIAKIVYAESSGKEADDGQRSET
jgi:4-carboxymuconolactone decarboxylase